MAGTKINVDITGQDQLTAALEHMSKRVANLRPALQDIGEYLLLAHDERFAAQESPEGDPWEPLNEKYKQRKKRNKEKILTLDDLLGGTLRYQASAASLVFGTDRVYGATHQFGRDEANIPARPFLGLSRADETEVLRLLENHLAGAL